MEKYKTIILIEKIKKSLEAGKCEEALEIAERIDKKKIKNMTDLSTIAECYFQNRKYQQAQELFLRMYEKNPSRRIVAQLVHLSIKLQDVQGANQYLSEFIKLAPEDFYRYIFQYSIDKMTKAPIVKLIEDLEDLKKAEYIESWAYELAKLYHKAGLKDKCVAECNDIVLWFGDGDYVDRAKALRAYYLGELDVSVCEKTGVSTLTPSESAFTESAISKDDEERQNAEQEEAATLESNEEVMEQNQEDASYDQEMSNEEAFDENEISAALALEIDGFFDQESEQTETETVDETESMDVETETVDETALIEDETESEEQIQDIGDEAQEFEEIKEDEILQIASDDKEVEEVIYRLLESERVENNLEAKTNYNKELQSSESKEKKILEKVQLDMLSNDEIVEDEALLDYFERNSINLSNLFGNFIRMERVQKQLVHSMDQALIQKDNINLIITGDPKSGKTKLAKCISKAFYRMNLIKSNQVALIDGIELNNIDIMDHCDQLADCVLIIEQAAKMSKDTVNDIEHLIEVLPNRVIIVLEDSKENMDRMLRKNTGLSGIFNNRIHLNPYTLEDYMGFAYDYLTEKEYEIEKQAYLALSDQVLEVTKKERENALPAIFSLLDAIIQKSEKCSAAQLRLMSESGHFEETDFMVLKREDIEQ